MYKRLRKYRRNDWTRDLFQEITLHPKDLIQPIFICEGHNIKNEIEKFEGVYKMSIDVAADFIKECKDLGIKLFALFPNVDPKDKSDDAKEAYNENNLMARAARHIKINVSGIGLMGDVALDPYTTHGHDGIVRYNYVLNDETVEILTKQALTLAMAGFDVVAPSDMMDGRILMINNALEENEYHDVLIFSYSAKFNSSLYGPFRNAVCSNLKHGKYLDKSTYQLSYKSSFEAKLELEQDALEYADALIIKPGMLYLDIVKDAKQFGLPLISYQVSGEYAMLKNAGSAGIVDYTKCMLESLYAFKRAGASNIITYAAYEIAKIIA
jgi:porphobilinogen synthase